MKIINDGRYVFTISLDILYFMKNNIDKVSKRKIPSERTIVQTDAKTNESICRSRSQPHSTNYKNARIRQQ